MNQLLQIKYYFDDFIAALLQNRRIIAKYLLILLPAAICFAAISSAGKIVGAGFVFKLCQALAFVNVGLVHFYLLNKKHSFYRLHLFGAGIFYTACVAIVICIALLFFYLFTENSLAQMAFISGGGFVLPHLSLQVWMLYKKIPPKQYRVWTAPAKEKDINELLIPKAVTFRFLLPVKNTDDEEEVFFKTVPEEWKLGKAFYSVLRNNNNDNLIEFRDESGAPCGWEFYSFLLNGLIKRRLEPEESLSDNRITSNATIHVRRVYTKTTLPSSN